MPHSDPHVLYATTLRLIGYAVGTGLSYDAGSENPEGTTVPWCSSADDAHHSRTNGAHAQLAPLDRWITMQTYTGSLPGFIAGLEEGLNCTGTKLGVGLSAAAVPCTLNASFYQARFEAMSSSSKKLGINVGQVSVWGMRDGTNNNNCYHVIWPYLKKWLAGEY